MSRGFKELVTICWDTFSDNIAMLTGPIQQLLLSCRRTPCPTIFYTCIDQCPIQIMDFSFLWLLSPNWPAHSPLNTASNIRTCLGMQIGRTESVNVISRSRMAIAKSCVSSFRLFKLKFLGVLISAWNKFVFPFLGEKLYWQNIHSRLTYYRNNEVVRFSSFFIFINFLQFKKV